MDLIAFILHGVTTVTIITLTIITVVVTTTTTDHTIITSRLWLKTLTKMGQELMEQEKLVETRLTTTIDL